MTSMRKRPPTGADPPTEARRMTIVEPKNEIARAMISVLVSLGSTPTLVVAAAELLIVDSQYETWFLEQVKPRATEAQLLTLIALAERTSDDVEKARLAFLAAQAGERPALERVQEVAAGFTTVLNDAAAKLTEAMWTPLGE